MTHACTDCGMVHELPGQLPIDAAAAPVIEAAPGPNEHDVEIAKIQADAEVKLAQTYSKQDDVDLVAENERLRGELAGLREGMELGAEAAADTAPPGPPIVVEPPAAPAEPAAAVLPPPADEPREPREPRKKNYFGF